MAPSKLNVQLKRKLDDDDDEEWTENKKGGKNKKKQSPLVKDPTEFMSPFRKPLAQSSLPINFPIGGGGDGTSFHVSKTL